MNNFIKFSTDIIAANSSKRELTGVIVPFGQVGHTNMGDVVFQQGSLKIGEGIKLFTEHDMTRPIGKLSRYEEDDKGIVGTFKIARTNAGDDALAEAQEGLRTGFSVGAMIDDYVTKGEQVIVNEATLKEVSHVTFPAFGEYAQITEVAASAETSQPTESEETLVSNEVTPEVVEEVAKAVEAPAVEAAERNVRPAIFTAPRSPIVSKASYLEHSIRAALGNEDSRQYVMAADTTGNNSAFIPTPQSTEVINGIANADRGFIDSLSKGTLPTAGMSFEIPKITTAPEVSETAEAAPFVETDTASSFVQVAVKKFGGQQTFSVELLDRSSPVFFDELVRQMEFAYAKATDTYVAAEVANAGVLNATAQNEDAAGLIAYVSSAAAAVYKGSLGFARNLVVSPEQWGKIMGYAESNGRPIYTASNPMNAGGSLSPQSLRGNVAGLDLYVSRSSIGTGGTGLGDYSMVVLNPNAYTWYESPRLSLRTNVINTGQIDVNYYGYGALATKIGAGANWFNKS
jgi:HK97 family phage prohead protease/HK97 family phage major capsid protein